VYLYLTIPEIYLILGKMLNINENRNRISKKEEKN